MKSTDRLWTKLRNKKYREAFVSEQARRVIPFQIRAIMRKRDISQQELAKKSGLTQGVISRAANPTYGKMTLNTVIRVAAGFDMAFLGVFVPFSRLERFFKYLSEEELASVATFDEEDKARGSDVVETVATSANSPHCSMLYDATPRGTLPMLRAGIDNNVTFNKVEIAAH